MAHLSGGVLGLLLLAAIVWAIVNVAQSQASPGAKALWIVLLLVLPVIGLVIWLIAGPRARAGPGWGPARDGTSPAWARADNDPVAG